jgi:hypothetical protein
MTRIRPPCHIRKGKEENTLCGIVITDDVYLNHAWIVWKVRDKVWCEECKEVWNTDYNNWNQQLE